jgi:5-methylcytosine-specific restriction protein A
LLPLGRGGADLPRNIIVVSPLIHRMLHHAEVPEIDLQKIKGDRLPIYINHRRYVIRWHPKHAAVVLSK